MKFEEKQFGKYDGGVFRDPSIITTCTEQELFFYINCFKGIIERFRDECIEYALPYQYAIEYCVINTSRFGVEIEMPKEGEHVEVTDSYKAWFKWWNNYFKKTLTREEFEEYQDKVYKGEDISKFRPEGDWHDIL